MRKTKFVRNLKEQLESEIFPANIGGSVFNIADSIACVLNEYQGNRFEDLWIYIEMMFGYKILTYHDEAEVYEIEGQYGIEKGCNVYRQYYIDICFRKGKLKCQNYILLERGLIKDMG